MVKVAGSIDALQEGRPLCVPEVRVWCHPEQLNKKGSDYYYKFECWNDAVEFIRVNPQAEPRPMLAIGGFELDLSRIELTPGARPSARKRAKALLRLGKKGEKVKL